MKTRYSKIITELNVKSLERLFTYAIPENLVDVVEVGSVVEIPFGRGNRLITGYVLELTDQIDFDPDKIKSILRVYESVGYEQELIQLAAWMRRRYLTTMSAALKILLPSRPATTPKTIKVVHCPLTHDQIYRLLETYEGKTSFEARVRVLTVLLDYGSIPLKRLLEEADVSQSSIKTLEKHGLLYVDEVLEYRMSYDVEDYGVTANLVPNQAQEEAILQVTGSVENGENKVYLLHGVTGSGKTEVYLQMIEKVLALGKSAIVLIPEIGLTPLMVRRFVERFGEVVGVMHSRLSEGERYDAWQMAKNGQIKVMIGPRSAIFAPFKDLGLIIIDEEHETTYKSEGQPKFHAREVAIYRGHYHQCPVVLGSATPLVESFYKANNGQYTLLSLPERAAALAPIAIETVDLREELAGGNRSMLSEKLVSAIGESLDKNEQVILFMNRRGYANFVSCRQCGYVIKCSSCDIPYHYHKYNQKLMCHYCGEHRPMVHVCPNCGSKHVRAFGTGTQKVEDEVARIFPKARLLRMDQDTTSGKDGHQKILDKFESRQADILIGTQMVAKGHHFDKVTLVGVLAADLSLYSNDFRASERTFQLLTQVIGRSGRGDYIGRAVIQTYTPEHYAIMYGTQQDYEGFYQEEIKYRQLMAYAPFGHMMSVLLTGMDERYLIGLSHKMVEQLKFQGKDLTILGPSPGVIAKVSGRYRQVIYVKGSDYKALTSMGMSLYNIMRQEDYRKSCSITIDMNPMMMY